MSGSTFVHADTPCVAFTADINTPTCRNCKGGNCEDNILPELLKQGLLTSGYFSIISSAKPAGNLKTSAASFEQSMTVWPNTNLPTGCKANAATVGFLTGQAELNPWGASIRTKLNPIMARSTPRQPIWPFSLRWTCWRSSESLWETGDSCSKKPHDRIPFSSWAR